jgi:hypothetical protein
MERAHKQAIREGNTPCEYAFRKVHTLLLGVFAESLLRKIIADPTGFNDRERILIWREKSQDQRWLSAVDFAARRHYQVPIHKPLADALPIDAADRVSSVSQLLRTQLSPVITDRNKLAHGQWVWQLQSRKEDAFVASQAAYDYNYVALDARLRLIDAIGRLVNILSVSEPTFQRDFDALMVEIDEATINLDGASYIQFARALQARKRP